MSLLYSILDPVVAHIDGFGTFNFCCAVGDTTGGGVIVTHIGRILRMSEIKERLAIDSSVLSVSIHASVFRFHGGTDDGWDDSRGNADGTVDGVRLIETVENDGTTCGNSSCTGSTVRFTEVGGIGMYRTCSCISEGRYIIWALG